ncbi:MAG: hypothetical protein M3N52_00705 [Actinomycetota bacterium]|nr:hypothetical protein [Actinomycetota bacterium]
MTPAAGLVLALMGGYGVFLVYTAAVLGWRGLGPGPGVTPNAPRPQRLRQWMVQAGLADVGLSELVAVVAALFVVGAGLAFAVFGGVAAPLVAGVFVGWLPVAAARARRRQRLEQARESWPRLIEEIRLQTTSMGRSVPQALFDVGRRGPEELRPAFEAAQREWLISTDFERSLNVLKARLADATADAVCETVLVAHEVGGSDIDRRLGALIEDRVQDLQGRKDAQAKQAGARFARWFVIVVPLGMACVGLSIGTGREAYASGFGQGAVVVGLMLMVACWLWAGRIMRLPEADRVFYESPPAGEGGG